MGDGEADAILPHLRKHICQSQGGKALELVDVHKEVSAFGWRCVGSAKGGKPNRRDEQSTEERGAIFADMTLGQIDQEDLALVHDAGGCANLFRAPLVSD